MESKTVVIVCFFAWQSFANARGVIFPKDSKDSTWNIMWFQVICESSTVGRLQKVRLHISAQCSITILMCVDVQFSTRNGLWQLQLASDRKRLIAKSILLKFRRYSTSQERGRRRGYIGRNEWFNSRWRTRIQRKNLSNIMVIISRNGPMTLHWFVLKTPSIFTSSFNQSNIQWRKFDRDRFCNSVCSMFASSQIVNMIELLVYFLFFTAGWGKLWHIYFTPIKLQAINLTAISYEVCKRESAVIHMGHLCTWDPIGKGTCDVSTYC